MSKEQMRLLRGKSSSHSLITSAMPCEQKQNEKRTPDGKTKKQNQKITGSDPKHQKSHKEYCNYR